MTISKRSKFFSLTIIAIIMLVSVVVIFGGIQYSVSNDGLMISYLDLLLQNPEISLWQLGMVNGVHIAIAVLLILYGGINAHGIIKGFESTSLSNMIEKTTWALLLMYVCTAVMALSILPIVPAAFMFGVINKKGMGEYDE